MAKIDCDWWIVRRKLGGACGASQATVRGEGPTYERRVPYVRLRPTSCHRDSRRQQEQRARWAYITQAWQRVLSQAERDEWNEFIEEPGFWWIDEEQQSRHTTGYEAFCGFNAEAMANGFALRTSPVWLLPLMSLTMLEIELLSPTLLRVWFEPNDYYSVRWWAPVLFGRGPDSPGCKHSVAVCDWWRHSVPSRWYWIGNAGLLASSPFDMELPRAVPPGRQLTVMGSFVGDSGGYGYDWLVASVVG